MIMIKVKQVVVIKKTMKQVMIINIKNVLEMMIKNNVMIKNKEYYSK